MITPIPLALSLSLFIPLLSSVSATFDPRLKERHPHNIHNPHRRALKRSITSDASTVNGDSFDFIIAGGGVAGLTLASRLSEWSNVTVLCIEAGGDGNDVIDQIDTPGYSYLNSLTNSAYDWAYKTVAQTDALNNVKGWPRGKGLGGSGAINGMFWGRPSEVELDAWATLNPNTDETWNWDEINNYIKKAENYTAPSTDVQNKFGMTVQTENHGHSGPIQVGHTEYIFDEVAKWIPAWKTLGFPSIDNAAGISRGAWLSTSTINVSNQTRSDSKAGYIDPLPPRSNLVILTGQQVTEVIFNGTKDASGNLIASGLKFQASSGATSYTVQANKEVLLSGGTVGSAQLLQLSGIGPAETLSAVNIDNKLDLPVGYNLQDHVSYSMYWTTPQGTFTWNNLSVSADLKASALTEYQTSKTGLWTYVNEAVGYPSMNDIMGSTSEASTYATQINTDMSTTVSNVQSWLDLPTNVVTGLSAQYAIQQTWMTTDVGQLEIILTMLGKGNNEMGIQVALQHPWSRGKIMINSSDPFTSPMINPDYFGVGYDIDIMNYGSAFARSLAAASPLSDVMITEDYPGATVTGDALANYTKLNSGTEYHPMGTCSMLPKDSGGVVDTTLTVYGTANLRVIDTSIAPLHISAHTMAITYGIAEKAVDIIKKKHWKQVVAQNTTSTSAAGSDSSSTASPGKATDSSVASANQDSVSSSGLSSGAKIGVGIGAGVGALAVLGALIFFFFLRKKKAASNAGEKGWYDQRNTQGGWHNGDGAYKEGYAAPPAQAQAYPMAAFDTHGDGNDDPSRGPAPFFAAHSRTHSVDTMATADLASRTPMRSQSGYGLSGSSTPYRDDHSDDGHGDLSGGGGVGHQYPTPEGAGQAWPRQQSYQPVNIR
ncbi:uncharacterized protein IL334_007887 [Kwoniella shivajii]|uniref:Glucose-methanol-choline oxidoreductase N-terminal domain-containing protein n=1 Tax=Kwoniella shivajii TaxID=564305 RepID=A0ABZ1DAS9_9TREE|nr:hypothetical protein IL334_007887 [Kwoniella shivajii]